MKEEEKNLVNTEKFKSLGEEERRKRVIFS